MIEDNDYPVEKIVHRRVIRRKLQYLVKWENFGNNENSWVNEEDLHCDELLDEFRAHSIICMYNIDFISSNCCTLVFFRFNFDICSCETR